MDCPELPDFDLHDQAAVENAFAAAPTLALRQSWLPAPHTDFRGGTLRIGWRADHLLILARLEDDHIVTAATRRNEPLFQLGDTLEIFVGAPCSLAYIEYHYAPNGTILQLLWPRSARELDLPAVGGLSAFALEDEESIHSIHAIPEGWQVCASIRLPPLLKIPANLKGRSLDLNFGRYDHADAHTPPILSATAPLPRCDFHDRPHWHRVNCASQMPEWD